MSDEENQDAEKCVSEVVKSMLVLDQSKKPFRLKDISKNLSKSLGRKSQNFILAESKSKLEKLGLNLVEIKNGNDKSFIIVKKLFPLTSMYRHADENEVADRTLLVLVLTYIFIKGGAVSKTDVFNHLQILNIYNESKSSHEYFGDVKKKILNEFISQLYLAKVSEKDSETYELRWGERAHAEVCKKSILEFFCEIGYDGSVKPEDLRSHYKVAMEDENHRQQIRY